MDHLKNTSLWKITMSIVGWVLGFFKRVKKKEQSHVFEGHHANINKAFSRCWEVKIS